MDNNFAQNVTLDAKEIQGIITQTVNEAVKAFPKPQIPSWFDRIIDFFKTNPLTFFLIVVLVILAISVIVRELVCMYFKTNELLARIKRIEERLK